MLKVALVLVVTVGAARVILPVVLAEGWFRGFFEKIGITAID